MKVSSEQSWHMFSNELANKKISLQSLYLYLKLVMLQGKWYCQSALGVNPINKEKELTQQQVSKYLKELINSDIITITKEPVKNQMYYRNIYNIEPIIPEESNGWRGIYNDFINLTTLSAKEKGFAALLSLIKYPKSIHGISKVTGISEMTTAKYIKNLQAVGVLSEDYYLNPDYFLIPYKERYEHQLKSLQNLIEDNKCAPISNTSIERIENQLEYFFKYFDVEKSNYKFLYKQLCNIEGGCWNLSEESKELESICA